MRKRHNLPAVVVDSRSKISTLKLFGKNITRRKRSAYDNSTVQERQLELLQSYMDSFDQMPEMNLHKDMVAKYLECGSGSSQSGDSPSLHGCLQKLNCIQNDKTVALSDVERQVADM